MTLYKINRVLHRDLGYFFFGMTIIYAISGIALNHRHQWNPNYIITRGEFKSEKAAAGEQIDRQFALEILKELNLNAVYRTHLVAGGNLRIYTDGGSVNIDLEDGSGSYEIIRKRPVFNQVNFLHYNTPKKLWTWFSDIYAGGLIVLAATGLFMIKGRNGITGRGAWLTVSGVIIPLVLLFLYM
jgi:uncharacterized protein